MLHRMFARACLALVAVCIATLGCSSSNEIQCGPGTVLDDRTCVPADATIDLGIDTRPTPPPDVAPDVVELGETGDASIDAVDASIGDAAGDAETSVDALADAAPIGEVGPATGAHIWSKRFGEKNTFIHSVSADAAGNVVLTGYFIGVVDFGTGKLVSAGGLDAFVAKFDPSGKALWSKRFGDAKDQGGLAVAADASGNLIVSAVFDGVMDVGGGPMTSKGGPMDIALFKLDPSGNYLWGKQFGDATLEQGIGLVVDGAGNIVMNGFSWGTVDFGSGPLTTTGPRGAIFIAKFAPTGAPLWSKLVQNTGVMFQPEMAPVSVDGSGNALLSGAFLGTLDFGTVSFASAGQRDAFLAKYSSSGVLLWAKRFGDALDQQASAAALDNGGNAYVVGNFKGTLNLGTGAMSAFGKGGDMFLARFDATGTCVWSKRFGDASANNVSNSHRMVIDNAGYPVFGGGLTGNFDLGGGTLKGHPTGSGSYPYIAKFDPSGSHLWSFVGNPAPEFVTASSGVPALSVDASRNVLIGTVIGAPYSFAGASLTPSGDLDGVLMKLAP